MEKGNTMYKAISQEDITCPECGCLHNHLKAKLERLAKDGDGLLIVCDECEAPFFVHRELFYMAENKKGEA